MVKKSALQFAKDKIFKVISSLSGGFLKVVMLNDSSTTYSISNNAIRPIPLTPEILEKNGWRTQNRWYYYLNVAEGFVSYIGIDFKHKSNKGHLYVDVDGNIVAYFLKNVPTSRIYAWGEKKLYPNIAIQTICEKIGAVYEDIEPSIKYCHYQYPNANKIVIFSKSENGFVHVSVPEKYNLYEASWSLNRGDCRACSYNDADVNCPALLVDGSRTVLLDHYCSDQGMFDLDKVFSKDSHTLQPIRSDVAVVLLYKES